MEDLIVARCAEALSQTQSVPEKAMYYSVCMSFVTIPKVDTFGLLDN